MVEEVKLKKVALKCYRDLISEQDYAEIEKLAKDLAGLKVIHLNTTSTGGGVAEILWSLVPLLKGAGLDAHWYTINPPKRFFNITKQIHNFLQGKKGDLTDAQRQFYLKVNQEVATDLARIPADIWFIHDPQVAATIEYHPNLHPSIWRCHIDTSHPNVFVWHFLSPFAQKYDRYIFTMRKYIGPGLDFKKAVVFTEAIDPLSRKNKAMSKLKAEKVIERFGVDPQRPLMTQVSRFDPWKDPWGVIDAYRIARKEFPNLQLALIGSFASDDPEAYNIVGDLKKYAKGDPDIFILSNQDGVGYREVNGFQVASKVILQKSTREGFGLTVSEAMWKGKPVIGGRAGGIIEQIVEGKTGFLVTTAHEAAEKISYILKNPKISDKMGQKGKERTREKFLITRLLRDHLQLYDELV